MVLAATEDSDNVFHGNRVYSFAIGGGDPELNWVSLPFALDQKAEGLAVWRTADCALKAAIVFDNDAEDTG